MRGLVVVKRRAVVALLGSAVAARPFAETEAEQRTSSVVGFLRSPSSGQVVDLVAAFRDGLMESGFSADQNVAIEYRSADNEPERLPALAANLIEQKVDMIAAAGGDRSAIAAKRATSKIPIVAVIGGDPVAKGTRYEPVASGRQSYWRQLSDCGPDCQAARADLGTCAKDQGRRPPGKL